MYETFLRCPPLTLYQKSIFLAPYPVNYDLENWNLLSQYLQSKNRHLIPELTRAKILHDAWNLAYAGELSFATAFNMTLFLKNERNHLVWDPVFTMIDHIGRHKICECINGKFQVGLSPCIGFSCIYFNHLFCFTGSWLRPR